MAIHECQNDIQVRRNNLVDLFDGEKILGYEMNKEKMLNVYIYTIISKVKSTYIRYSFKRLFVKKLNYLEVQLF